MGIRSSESAFFETMSQDQGPEIPAWTLLGVGLTDKSPKHEWPVGLVVIGGNMGFRKLSLIPVMIFAVACNSARFQLAEDGIQNNQGVNTDQAQCELDPVDYNLKTSVYSFELTDSGNVTFGFNVLNNFFKALNLSMNLKMGEMDLTMTMTDPLHTETPLVSVGGQSTFKSGGLSASVDLSQIALGFSFFGQTPLAKLTQNGLQSGFTNALTKLQTIQTPWQTKVTAAPDDESVIVSVGSLAGLKVGDQFGVYNVRNVWAGAPCASELIISQKLSEQPLAIVKAIQVQSNAAVLQIVSRNSGDPIKPGALVEISQLVQASKKDTRTLLRAIRVTDIDSKPLAIGNVDVNITNYLQEQIGPIVTASGFYLHQ